MVNPSLESLPLLSSKKALPLLSSKKDWSSSSSEAKAKIDAVVAVLLGGKQHCLLLLPLEEE